MLNMICACCSKAWSVHGHLCECGLAGTCGDVQLRALVAALPFSIIHIRSLSILLAPCRPSMALERSSLGWSRVGALIVVELASMLRHHCNDRVPRHFPTPQCVLVVPGHAQVSFGCPAAGLCSKPCGAKMRSNCRTRCFLASGRACCGRQVCWRQTGLGSGLGTLKRPWPCSPQASGKAASHSHWCETHPQLAYSTLG